MLNKLLSTVRKYDMVSAGDHIICALSGGADSVALTFALYLLKDKLGIRLSAAHFNHHLRGEESDRDEAFVREFCGRYDIHLYAGGAEVKPGKKGLEAAARDARYGFLRTLPGKLATAHTADDNAETVLLHLIRGTGLKGLGGITPVGAGLIRPLLDVTRQEVEEFCAEWCLSFITDSSNETDAFLRNRVRHQVMPLLKQENPRLAENVSAMAQRLRLDAEFLSDVGDIPMEVEVLRRLHAAPRSRVLEKFLRDSGVPEPEAVHIARLEALLESKNPSARAEFPGGVTVGREYGRLVRLEERAAPAPMELPCPGSVCWGDFLVTAQIAQTLENAPDTFTVCPEGPMLLRSRAPGDAIRLPGGKKSLKKLLIDRKIPAARRPQLPVLTDEAGVLGVYTVGADLDRRAQTLPAVTVRFRKKEI